MRISTIKNRNYKKETNDNTGVEEYITLLQNLREVQQNT